MNKREFVKELREKDLKDFLTTQSVSKDEYHCSERELAEQFVNEFLDFINPPTYNALIDDLKNDKEKATQFLIDAGFVVKNENGEVELAKEYV